MSTSLFVYLIPRTITSLSHWIDCSIIPIMEITNYRTSWEKAKLLSIKRVM